MRRVTIKDIASATGLSVNSVSHALRDMSDISEKTKELVRQKAEELGYVKNLLASGLRDNSTKTIAVLYDFLLNPYYSVMTAFLEQALAARGYRIMIFTESNKDASFTENIYKNIISHNVDGIISFLQADSKARKFIKSTGAKIVILGRECDYFNCVCADDAKGGYMITKHLLDQGHRKILMLCSQLEVSCGMRRLEGYKKALEEASVPIDQNLIYFWSKDYYSPNTIIDKCAAEGIDYSAIVCFNDFTAFEVINYLKSKGIKIPSQVAVTGYDNIQNELNFFEKITTIGADKKGMALTAVDVLLDSLEHQSEGKVRKINDIKFIKGYTT